ncbi:hypothetical protein BGZ80_005300 [Entomortierella chlamydospora]|uniref:Uncharacterized protein n=1 Tax=Entomortierella chlamydospora TaxID=101097 RepID=A0A9P6N0W4_9FUNG|nr:hypothetical protein BGZ79_007251 [Entomortierella chlamydospora]KAG0019759.1 hypothetical protein BGZ80_005300 [Entomortierella chlamydospora]
MSMSLSPALSLSSPCSSLSYTPESNKPRHSNGYHNRTTSESILFTPPLSPTEEQLLAFLIPDIEPSELAAYLSAPSTPILSDVSCLIGNNTPIAEDHCSSNSQRFDAEAVYPSPVCAAAAATVVAIDRLDGGFHPTVVSSTPESENLNSMSQFRKKRCSTYAFMSSDDEDEESVASSDFPSCPVYVMSSRNTRKRLMLEQAFVSPDDEDYNQNCYAQLFQGASSDEMDSTSDLTSTLAFDLVLA